MAKKPMLRYSILTLIIISFHFSCQVKIERREVLKNANISVQNFIIPTETGIIAGDSMLMFANGKATSNKFPLNPGTYSILISGKGTQAYEVYPHLKVYLNDLLVGEPQLSARYRVVSVPLKILKEDVYQLDIVFENDGLDDVGNNRDVMIRSISIQEGEVESEVIKNETTTDTSNAAIAFDVFNITDFKLPSNVGDFDQPTVMHIKSNGDAESKKNISLVTGQYKLKLEAKGTQAYEVYPKLKILLNDKLIEEIQVGQDYSFYSVPIDISTNGDYKIDLVFDSDGLDDKGNDRDVFIKSIGIEKLKKLSN